MQVGEWKKLLCGLLVEILEIRRRFVRVKKLLCSVVTTLMPSMTTLMLCEKNYKSPYKLKNTIKVHQN